MGLYKLDIDDIKGIMEWDNLSILNNSVLNRKVITRIILNINQEHLKNGYSSSIIINESLLDYFMDSSSYLMGNINKDNVDYNDIIPIGNLMGHNVFLTTLLDKDEYFIGDYKQLQISKRKDKITKLLQR